MWKFKQLILTNFLSHQHSIFPIEDKLTKLICGENLDNEGQEGNGTGKSAITEGICIALSGNSIRSVKTKELVRDGEKEAHIELTAENKVLDKELKIIRKLYSNTKPSEVEVYINDKQNKQLTSVNEANNFIFETLGISKEDFFNFYIITKEKYTPFLSASDTKKKEIISRFSNSDKIDSIPEYIKQEVETIQTSINTLENKNVAAEAKLEAYHEQLNDMPTKKEFEEKKTERIKERQNNINEIVETFSKNKDKITEKEIELKSKKTELSTLEKKSFDDKLEFIEGQIEKQQANIEEYQKEYNEVENKFKPDIENNKEKISEYNIEIININNEIREFETFISDVEKQLLDVIECPKCSHRFSLKNEEFDVYEAEQMLPSVKDSIEELQLNKQSVTDKIEELLAEAQNIKYNIQKEQEEINHTINNFRTFLQDKEKTKSELNVQIDKHKTKVRIIKNNIGSLDSEIKILKQQNNNLQSNIDQLKKEIEEIKKQKPDNTGKVDELKDKIKKGKEFIKQNESELETLHKQKSDKEEWIYNFKSFKSHLANKSIDAVTGFANLFLEGIKSDLEINISGYKVLSNGDVREKLDSQVLRNGENVGSYGRFSGGERSRINVCVDLAIQQLINLNSNTGGIEFIMYDEAIESVDSLGLELIIKSFGHLEKTMYVITQNQIKTIEEQTILVKKENGTSKIIL